MPPPWRHVEAQLEEKFIAPLLVQLGWSEPIKWASRCKGNLPSPITAWCCIPGKSKTVEAYFDAYDQAMIRKEKGFKSWREISVKKGDVILKSASNSRKTTASYDTEPVLSQPLVKASVNHAIAAATARGNTDGRAFMDLKILDNACGSGHFLLEALGYLTDLALAPLDTDTALQYMVNEERTKITEQLQFLNLGYVQEDAQILKRALLKTICSWTT